MRENYLFAEQATIHNVVEHQKKEVLKALEVLPSQKVLADPLETITAEIVEGFRLDVPFLDRAGIVQLPNEEIDIDVSHDWQRVFHTPGPHYVKGTALRVAIPFKGKAALFRYGNSPFNSPIPGEIRDDTIILTYSAEHPDAATAQSDFESRIQRIESRLQMVRGPVDEWNRQLPDMVRNRLQQRRAKLERDQTLTLGYPSAPNKVAAVPTGKAIKQRDQQFDLFLSHASEDKEAIARPLYSALVAAGVSVWFDEAVLELGDSLRRKIDEGLARCRYGIVILSPRFLAKQWPQRELDGLVARETATGEKAICQSGTSWIVIPCYVTPRL
jgi:TIR domain